MIKKIVIVLLSLSALAVSYQLLSAPASTPGPNTAAPTLADEDIACPMVLAAIQPPELFKRGCCSHHGGVCGCREGRALCCDGTLSPTCGCD